MYEVPLSRAGSVRGASINGLIEWGLRNRTKKKYAPRNVEIDANTIYLITERLMNVMCYLMWYQVVDSIFCCFKKNTKYFANVVPAADKKNRRPGRHWQNTRPPIKKIRHNKTFVPTSLEVGNENACIQTLGSWSSACSRTTPLGVGQLCGDPLEVWMNFLIKSRENVCMRCPCHGQDL